MIPTIVQSATQINPGSTNCVENMTRSGTEYAIAFNATGDRYAQLSAF